MRIQNISLVLLSALFMTLAYTTAWGYPLLLVALIPLLKIEKKQWFHAAMAFLVWNIFSVFWVRHANLPGAILAILINTFLSTLPFILYGIVKKRAPKTLAYTLLITSWIGLEYIYYNGQLSFPWLILGNGLANGAKFVQWYEYTGVFGGSLWILLTNILVFERKKVIAPIVAILPIVISITIYHTYKEPENPIKVTVVQPNFDPYTEKFGGISQLQQTEIIVDLAKEAPFDVNYIVTPETSFDDNIIENTINYNRTVLYLQDFVRANYPNTTIIAGATTHRQYTSQETETARNYGGTLYYDTYNTAIEITTDTTDIYHKSKLVAGAETIPFRKQLKFMENFALDLGGVMGQIGIDKSQNIFGNIAVAICYESIYGEFCTEYIRKGAQAIFIITNDGWWRDTHGYRQHFSFARLRAIETRRSIARSANTGISGFIDQRGNVIAKTKWDERCTMTREINLNTKETFYSKTGDYLGRLSLYTAILCLLYFVSYIYRKKDHIVK